MRRGILDTGAAMRVALLVPCYVDQLRPRVAWAALALLEAQGLEVAFPADQGCCGQPLLSSGDLAGARTLARRQLDVFAGFDAVVAPSASCVATVRRHLAGLLGDAPGVADLARRCFELCEFLVHELGVTGVRGRYPHRVGLHASCHALRALRLGAASERVEAPREDPARTLLAALDGIELREPARADECCGFGGSFAVSEAAVSRRMGLDRLEAHAAAGAEVLASTDLSCLLHLEGLARRRGLVLRARHVAEILAEAAGAA